MTERNDYVHHAVGHREGHEYRGCRVCMGTMKEYGPAIGPEGGRQPSWAGTYGWASTRPHEFGIHEDAEVLIEEFATALTRWGR